MPSKLKPQNARTSRTKRKPKSAQTPTIAIKPEKAVGKSTARGGLRRPSAQVAELLRLANLVGPGYEFAELLTEPDDLRHLSDAQLKLELVLGVSGPGPAESPGGGILEGLKENKLMPHLLDSLKSKVPELLRAELLDHMNRPNEWRPYALDEEPDTRIVREYARVVAVIIRHNQIWEVRDGLRTLIEGDLPYIPVRHSITSLFVDKATGIVQERVVTGGSNNLFYNAVKGVAAHDLRRCEIEKCRRFFFARRSSSVVCEPGGTCAATYAKRQERKNAKERERLKQLAADNKKKRARTAHPERS